MTTIELDDFELEIVKNAVEQAVASTTTNQQSLVDAGLISADSLLDIADADSDGWEGPGVLALVTLRDKLSKL